MEKQIVTARADEAAMAAIRADPQILEEHLVVSRADIATQLASFKRQSMTFSRGHRWCLR